MNDSRFMRIIERFADVIKKAHNFRDRHSAVFYDRRFEGFSLDEWHREVQEIILLARREQRHDVRVLKLRGNLHLAAEPAAVYFGSQLRRKNFDDYLSSKYPVGCNEHTTHPATTELALDFVCSGERVFQSPFEFRHIGGVITGGYGTARTGRTQFPPYSGNRVRQKLRTSVLEITTNYEVTRQNSGSDMSRPQMRTSTGASLNKSRRPTAMGWITAMTATGVTLACSTAEPTREPAPSAAMTAPALQAAPALWYNQTRMLDLTNDGQKDTVRLEAMGERPDSLQIRLMLLVDGHEKHREEWGSSYELALADSASLRSQRVDALLRARLDSVLASVKVQPLDAPGVRLMAEDSAILTGLDPRPTHRISFTYGYESTTRLVWDTPRKRFVRLWTCC